MEKFNMSYTAVISFVMRHSIPRIKDKEKQCYSPLYSKMPLIANILKTYHVERIKVGKFSKIPRKIFDDVMFKHRNEKISLYLDYYPAIRNPETMAMSRREYLGIYIYAHPKNEIERRSALALALARTSTSRCLTRQKPSAAFG